MQEKVVLASFSPIDGVWVRRGGDVDWKGWWDQLQARLAPIIADAIVMSAILGGITIVSFLNVWSNPPGGVVFFSGAAFPLRLSLLLDAIDVLVVILFGVRTVWHAMKGVWK